MTRHSVAARDEIYPARFVGPKGLPWRRLPESTAATLIIGSTLLFAVATAWFGAAPANWFGNAMTPASARVAAGLTIAAAALALGNSPRRRFALAVLLGIWVIASAISGSSWISDIHDVSNAVSLIEAVVIAAALSVLIFPRSSIAFRALAWTTSAMMLMFGSIHLVHRDAISGLLPEGFPAANIWPLMTGLILIVAGLASLVARWRRIAAMAIAAMFLSWIPVVHVARLIAGNSSHEWIFAITALALAGSLMLSGSRLFARSY